MFPPVNRSGTGTLLGEGLGRHEADKTGIACVALRIGSFQVKPKDVRMLSTWISHRDMVHLVRRALEAEDVPFEIVYGVSANDRNWWDNPGGQRIGYAPQDNAEDHAAEILSRMAPADEPEIERAFHGGPFCALEFSVEPSNVA